MEVNIFEPPPLLDSVTVAELVLETVELELIVRVPPGLLEISEVPDTLPVILFVIEPIDDLVRVAEALGVLEAGDADKVGVVVEVFEVDADLVPRDVCEGWCVELGWALVVRETVSVFEEHAVPVE